MYLAEEVQEEILVRLPVKTLLRFKSVSKTWCSLIQSRSFIDYHRRRNSGQYSGKLACSPYAWNHKSIARWIKGSYLPTDLLNVVLGPSNLLLPKKMTQWESPPDGEPWEHLDHVLGPLNNGIYCLATHWERGLNTSIAAVCNPATRTYRFINPFPSELYLELSYLAQNYLYRINYGFGMVGTDYKVVVVITWGGRFSSFMSLSYSLQRGTWVKIADYEVGEKPVGNGVIRQGMLEYPEIIYKDLALCSQSFINGCWHWLAVQSDRTFSILSYNLGDDAFRQMDVPGNHMVFYRAGVLVLNGRLAMVTVSESVEFWMMREYGVEDSWEKIYSVQIKNAYVLERLVGIFPRRGHCTRDDNSITSVLFEDRYGNLVHCDEYGYRTYTVHRISLFICWNTPGISTYMETLEPL